MEDVHNFRHLARIHRAAVRIGHKMGPTLRRGTPFFAVIVLKIFGTYAELESFVGAYEIGRDGAIYKLHYHPRIRSKELLVTVSHWPSSMSLETQYIRARLARPGPFSSPLYVKFYEPRSTENLSHQGYVSNLFAFTLYWMTRFSPRTKTG